MDPINYHLELCYAPRTTSSQVYTINEILEREGLKQIRFIQVHSNINQKGSLEASYRKAENKTPQTITIRPFNEVRYLGLNELNPAYYAVSFEPATKDDNAHLIINQLKGMGESQEEGKTLARVILYASGKKPSSK